MPHSVSLKKFTEIENAMDLNIETCARTEESVHFFLCVIGSQKLKTVFVDVIGRLKTVCACAWLVLSLTTWTKKLVIRSARLILAV